MAVVIRMKRTGRRNRPCYRISVADSRSPRDGRTLETIGLYDPVSPNKENQMTVKVERARHWLEHGALPSETVRSLFKRAGVYEGFGKPKAPRKRPGRKKKTATTAKRVAAKTMRAERKQVRQTERIQAKRVAAKAAASAESEE